MKLFVSSLDNKYTVDHIDGHLVYIKEKTLLGNNLRYNAKEKSVEGEVRDGVWDYLINDVSHACIYVSDTSMNWEFCDSFNGWIASRPMYENSVYDFIYTIYNKDGKYEAHAHNNGYGAYRVAVENMDSYETHRFSDLIKLIEEIENREIFWLYTGACNCIGTVTKEEY